MPHKHVLFFYFKCPHYFSFLFHNGKCYNVPLLWFPVICVSIVREALVWLNKVIILVIVIHWKLSSDGSLSLSHLLLVLSHHVFISNSMCCKELGGVVGSQGAAVRGWTSEGFYKNNSLTDNLLASSLRRLRVPFGEGAFLFQPHRESPESQGWSHWVLIAFFPLFCQSAYSDEGKKGMKALQTLMKPSAVYSLWSLLLLAGWVVEEEVEPEQLSVWLVDFEVSVESLAARSVSLLKKISQSNSERGRN